MNHIKSLQRELAAYKEMVTDLRRYCQSDKFHKDVMVNTGDILDRSRIEVYLDMVDAREQAKEEAK